MYRLIKILSDLYPDENFTDGTRLIDDKILNSLDIVSLVTDVNEAYGVNIGAEDVIPENFGSIDEIRSLIERRGGKCN